MNLETEISRELWQAVRRSYESQVWSNAVLDSIHCLSDALRAKTGLQSDGISLVGQALGGKTPKLRLNRLQTESEKNVQAGVEQLLRGLYQAIRNPRSHERLEDTQTDADALIVFVDYVLKLIGHARSAFSVEECVNRIVEENFVPDKRYATLLIEKIPPRQRLQVALAVYQRKLESDGEKLNYFFDAVIPMLEEGDAQELFRAISEELQESDDDKALRYVLQLLTPSYWLQLDEVARLRSENRLIGNLQDGRYICTSGKCLAGALATWSKDFWPYFSLKDEVLRVLCGKLGSTSTESQDYVFQFFFAALDYLAEKPSWLLNSILHRQLNAGDARFHQAINKSYLWKNERWSPNIQQAMKTFQQAEPVREGEDLDFAPPLEDDDTPF